MQVKNNYSDDAISSKVKGAQMLKPILSLSFSCFPKVSQILATFFIASLLVGTSFFTACDSGSDSGESSDKDSTTDKDTSTSNSDSDGDSDRDTDSPQVDTPPIEQCDLVSQTGCTASGGFDVRCSIKVLSNSPYEPSKKCISYTASSSQATDAVCEYGSVGVFGFDNCDAGDLCVDLKNENNLACKTMCLTTDDQCPDDADNNPQNCIKRLGILPEGEPSADGFCQPACDLIAQDDCPNENDACYLIVTETDGLYYGKSQCRIAGTKTLGEICESGKPDDCAGGSYCALVSGETRCHQNCTHDSENPGSNVCSGGDVEGFSCLPTGVKAGVGVCVDTTIGK
jgi:hypothetical protein